MQTRYQSHLARCGVCGRTFTARYLPYGGRYFCRGKGCQAESRRWRAEQMRKTAEERAADALLAGHILRLDPAVVSGPLVVVVDPLDVGGWPPGKVFSNDEWRGMFRVFTFTPGTILRDGLGRLFRYEIGKDGHDVAGNE